MKVLAYNIHGWCTPQGLPNLDLLAQVIADSGADLVGLNEVFHPMPTGEGGGPALAVLAGRLGMSFAFGAALDREESPNGFPYGNAALSRWPLLAHAAHHLPEAPGHERRGLLEARVLLPDGRPFSVYVTHLDHRSEEVRVAQWNGAGAWLIRDRSRPHLLIGDFNALAPADYAAPAALAALAAYNAGQGWQPPDFDLAAQVLKAGYADAFAQRGDGGAPTWPAVQPERRIDYIFLPEKWASALVSCRRWESPAAARASDHLPLLAEIVWPSARD